MNFVDHGLSCITGNFLGGDDQRRAGRPTRWRGTI